MNRLAVLWKFYMWVYSWFQFACGSLFGAIVNLYPNCLQIQNYLDHGSLIKRAEVIYCVSYNFIPFKMYFVYYKSSTLDLTTIPIRNQAMTINEII